MLPNSPHPLLSPFQSCPVSNHIVSTSLDVVDWHIVLYEENDFFFVIEGGWEVKLKALLSVWALSANLTLSMIAL